MSIDKLIEAGKPHRFKAGFSPWEGTVMRPDHKEAVRQAAFKRAERDYPHVSVKGVVYPNLTRAAAAVGVSASTIRSRALSNKDEHNDVFFTTSPSH